MFETIQSKLKEIEEHEQVKILYAVESGSRAWGFASPDSDYDVRFIYVRPAEYYLKLEKTHDVIEWQLDETLDINGWDLQKALRLLHSSNPTFFEWYNSPIVYRTTSEWEELKPMIHHYFSPKAGLYHYLNMATSNYREYLKQETVRLKKYFYVIRPILACKWILDKKSAPPILFADLASAELESELQPVIADLLDRKIHAPEIECAPKIEVLNAYIDQQLKTLKIQTDTMEREQGIDYEELNQAFLSILKQQNTL